MRMVGLALDHRLDDARVVAAEIDEAVSDAGLVACFSSVVALCTSSYLVLFSFVSCCAMQKSGEVYTDLP